MKNNEDDEDNVMVGFAKLEFNPKEDNLEDHAIMSGKQIKILNSKLNSILQFLNDSVGKSTISGKEVQYLLKSQESSTKNLTDGVNKRIDEWLALYSRNYNHEIEKLRDVARE